MAALFDTHHQRLYRLARRMTSSADDALDLVQEAYLRAARAPLAIPAGEQAEEAWLVRVLVNLGRDRWRHAEVRHRHGAVVRRSAGVQVDHEAAVVARATIARALETLPPRRRAILVMHELEGLDTAGIASMLGISRITVRWHLALARRALATALTATTGAHDGIR